MEKMNKIVVAIRISPKTKEKLEKLRVSTGLPYGVIIDNLIEKATKNGPHISADHQI
jgi:predicted DNA-binding protein